VIRLIGRATKQILPLDRLQTNADQTNGCCI